MFEFCWHDQGALRFFLSHYFTILDTCRKHLLPMFDSMDTLRNTPFALVCQLASYTLKITKKNCPAFGMISGRRDFRTMKPL